MQLLKLLIQWLLLASSLLAIEEEEEHYSNSNPNCSPSCGNLTIPYPFGIGKHCSMEGFEITCNTTHNPPRAFLAAKGYEVVTISMKHNRVHINNSFQTTAVHVKGFFNGTNEPHPQIYIDLFQTPFAFSHFNKFTVTGCNSEGQIQLGGRRDIVTSGCISICERDSIDNVNGTCSGYGCCQTPIFSGLKTVGMSVQNIYTNESVIREMLNTSTTTISPSYRCASGFLAEKNTFHLDAYDLDHCLLPHFRNSHVVLDWVVSPSQTCEDARTKLEDYACKGNSSSCEDYRTEDGHGYRCVCNSGYQGNPYLDHGCQGFIGLLILLLLVTSVYFILKRRKLMKLREKFFRENGGLLLQQQKPFRQSAVETTKIFTANELLKATDNYSESRIIGQGGNGTVYKGVIGNNNQVVAIKRSKIEAKTQIEQFINEVVVVSQINHRNVVKLLGCCLETEVPLLVYEFVSNVQGTFGYLDPQYFQTSQLTQKSDVYSYGVVLIELITGELPVSFARPEPQRSLSSYFIFSMQQDRLFEILEPGLANDENREEVKVVADLAMRCVMLKGEERPLMREVLIELIELRKVEKHPWGQANCEEALSLLNQQFESYPTHSSSSVYSGGMPTDLALSLDCPR
ncbi:hypothetical protein COLO4_27744 [Corchorus olitorius]|uniref:Protein kinase domain-containing protein n=1 Tax=Corchorus olitorius TaxID=93759 RepID=A0A1R3HPE5_9ROSI|nr:hypothetical protein COLO4_27744 [Corchorus olitorius]